MMIFDRVARPKGCRGPGGRYVHGQLSPHQPRPSHQCMYVPKYVITGMPVLYNIFHNLL